MSREGLKRAGLARYNSSISAITLSSKKSSEADLTVTPRTNMLIRMVCAEPGCEMVKRQKRPRQSETTGRKDRIHALFSSSTCLTVFAISLLVRGFMTKERMPAARAASASTI
ncbi:MAG: hypothetical protein A4E57_02242 [Syntrophorhabdaceae bacterium PtaU1.Bin034]|nr:MAG: hypothetical protein A4E57_02242 [Syntrophorhabdaceae bacterium PtaU1.Bin034]